MGLQVVVPAATAQRHQELRELLAGYHWLAKRLVKTQWISLPNLIAQESVVPELIQHAATPEAIAEQCMQRCSVMPASVPRRPLPPW